MFGTDQTLKHDEPQLPWDGFFTFQGFISEDKTQSKEGPDSIANEFEVIPLAGNVFKEVAFYHKPSKSLLGITDMMVATKEMDSADFLRIPWLLRCYFFSLGLYRHDLPSPVATQSYHLLFTTNQTLLRASVAHILEKDVQHISLGHGGVFHGKEECDMALKSGFRWVFNHNPPLFESFIVKLKWTRAFTGFPF